METNFEEHRPLCLEAEKKERGEFANFFVQKYIPRNSCQVKTILAVFPMIDF